MVWYNCEFPPQSGMKRQSWCTIYLFSSDEGGSFICKCTFYYTWILVTYSGYVASSPMLYWTLPFCRGIWIQRLGQSWHSICPWIIKKMSQITSLMGIFEEWIGKEVWETGKYIRSPTFIWSWVSNICFPTSSQTLFVVRHFTVLRRVGNSLSLV